MIKNSANPSLNEIKQLREEYEKELNDLLRLRCKELMRYGGVSLNLISDYGHYDYTSHEIKINLKL